MRTWGVLTAEVLKIVHMLYFNRGTAQPAPMELYISFAQLKNSSMVSNINTIRLIIILKLSCYYYIDLNPTTEAWNFHTAERKIFSTETSVISILLFMRFVFPFEMKSNTIETYQSANMFWTWISTWIPIRSTEFHESWISHNPTIRIPSWVQPRNGPELCNQFLKGSAKVFFAIFS